MFATRALLVTLFGASEIETLTGHSADEAEYGERVDAALHTANTEVEGYLQGVVALPLVEVPEALAVKAAHMAHYHLALDAPTEGAQLRYKAAIRFLERVQDGKSGLGLTASNEEAPRQDVVVSSRPARTFDATGF